MGFNEIASYLLKNFTFSFVVVLVSFILGWLLYSNIVIKGISLKDSLFEKDNLAAWIEFIGAFVFPTLYLSSKAIQGPAHEKFFMDLLICTTYAVAYIIIFTLLRLLYGIIVKLAGISDEQGRVNLNSEIYKQKNISASLFSVVLSVIFANSIKFLDIDPEYITISLLKISNVIIFTLIAIAVYIFVLRRKTTLFKEIFADNNIAAGVSLLGYILAVELILDNAITLQTVFNFTDLLIFSAMNLIILGILSLLVKLLFTALLRVEFWKEIYEQNSIGAAIGQCGLYIGLANIIINYLK